ncbi:MAG: LacI family transcriptional regulator [Lachnospiraceae bacterium]|nr:LacI family transcriptional regulator [Lachnospiraceae bacterium]
MSLKKIAEMVGTSPSTVSRVLNNSYDTCASEELKEKIWAAAREIHYVPNTYARELKKQRTPQRQRSVSIVLARVRSLEEDSFFRELYRDLEIQIFQAGLLLDEVVNTEEMSEKEMRETDGIVILGRSSGRLLTALQERTRNLVGIWRNPTDFAIDEVVCDGRKAAEQAVRYLLAKGHRKIGYIGDCSYESRYVGYCDTMIRHQLPLNSEDIFETDQTTGAGYEAMQALLARSEITAVLCANDMTAFGALKALAEPRESGRPVAVISIDDVREAQTTTPLLTTIRIPRGDMAHMAVQVLQDRMRHGHTEKLRVEFTGRIVERESCFALNG